jgi:hypothetical protein
VVETAVPSPATLPDLQAKEEKRAIKSEQNRITVCQFALNRGGVQVMPEAVLPFAPPTAPRFKAADSDGSQKGPVEQNNTQTASSSDRSLAALIKRGALDQKQIYLAPFHRQ